MTADMVEIKRSPELEVEHDVTELEQSHNKTFNREESCFLWMRKKQMLVLRQKLLTVKIFDWYLKIVEITTKDLEYYINSVDKAKAGFERIDSNFESSIVSNNIKQYQIIY